MDVNLDRVKEFHEVFLLPISYVPYFDKDDLSLRVRLIQEELDEVKKTTCLSELLQELCDVQYTLDSAFVSSGLYLYKEEAMKEIHRANMSKLDENGNPIHREDGKIVKSSLFIPADIKSILKET